MPIDLPTLVRTKGIRRKAIELRPIIPTAAQAADLAAIIAPAWRIWAERIDAIMAGYDPAPLARDALTTDSAAQMQSTIEATANDFLARLVAIITPGLRRWAINVERVHRGKWVAAVKAGTGVDLSTILTSLEVQETVEVFVSRNVALVKNISEQAEARIADAVFRGYQERTPAREVAKTIREATGMGRRRAIGIAGDQSSKLSAALDTQRQVEAGLEFFKWRHSGKRFPRAEHKARDGKVYEIVSGKELDGGSTVPADDRPGMRPYCGCRAAAFLPIMDELE